MDEILEFLLENESYSLYNEESERKITISIEDENSWDIFKNGDSVNPIITTDNIDVAIEVFNNEII